MRKFVLFLLPVSALFAQANQPIPFTFTLVSSPYPSSSDAPQPAVLNYTGTSTFGPCEYTETAHSGPPPSSVTLTFDFSKGTLSITSTSSLQNPFAPVNYSISGGTGMFTGASGSLTGTSTYAYPTSTTETTTFTATGTITLAGGAGVTVLPPSLQVQTPAGTPAASLIALNNQDGSSVNYSAAVDAPSTTPWLSVSPGSGTVNGGAAASLQVTMNPGGMALGVYQGQIDLNISGGQVQVPVTMQVGNQGAKLTLSQTGLQFLASAGGPSPATQTISAANTEMGDLSGLTATTSVTGEGPNWLQATIAPGFASQTTASVNITVSPGNLVPGTYSGQVTFKLPSAFNSPQTMTVQMVVATAYPTFQPPAIMARIPYDTGSGTVTGAIPGPYTVIVTNPSSQALSFTIQPVGVSPQPTDSFSYFNLSMQSGSVPAGGNAQIPISVNSACFTDPMCNYDVQSPWSFDGWVISFPAINYSYTYWANIVLTGPSSAAPIPSWGAPPPGISYPTGSAVPSRLHPMAAGSDVCTPSVLNGYLTSMPASGFQTTVGAPTPLAITIFDNCNNNLNDGTVIASFSDGDLAVPLAPRGNGEWSATWVPSKSASNTVMSIEAVSSNGVAGSGYVPGNVAANTSTPVVPPGGVSNAASSVPLIAPGAFISIYGENLAAATSIESSATYPTSLGSVQVFLDGEPLPLYFTANKQIDAIVPFDIEPNTSPQLVVQNGTALSTPEPVNVVAASPGVFTQNQSGTGPGAILNVPVKGTPGLNTPANPATGGDVLEIFCTGLGQVSPAATAGTPASTTTLSHTANTVMATIGGQDAQVAFAGLAPGFVGLYQVNAVVPAGIAPSSSVPLVLKVGGASSVPVAVALY
jgi:uncharacterized protein (TIGR03437 family)